MSGESRSCGTPSRIVSVASQTLPVGEDAGGRVADVVDDVDVELAEVGHGDADLAQGGVQAGLAQRRRHEVDALEQRLGLHRRPEDDHPYLLRLVPSREQGHGVTPPVRTA